MPTTTMTMPSTQPALCVDNLSLNLSSRSYLSTQSQYCLTSQQRAQHEIPFNHQPRSPVRQTVPEWVLRVVSAAAAGEVEFRREAVRLISEGKGPQLLKFMKDLEFEAPPEAARGMHRLVGRVERWIRNPHRVVYVAPVEQECEEKLVFCLKSPPREGVMRGAHQSAKSTFVPISQPLNVSNVSTPTFSTPSPLQTPIQTPSPHTPSPIPGSTSFDYEHQADSTIQSIASPGPSSMRGQWQVEEVMTTTTMQRGRAYSLEVESEQRSNSVPPSRSPSPCATRYVGVW